MPVLHYATYFDRHYLTRGLALYQSLVEHSPRFTLWVLCLDATTEAVLRKLALPGIGLMPLADLERADPALLEAKRGRSTIEYYWTLTAAWLVHLFDHHQEIDLLTYLDADLFFYGDPTPLFEELGSGSMLALPSRYSPTAKSRSNSRFNVGFNAFRRSSQGLACLRRWREQCLEWCFDRHEPGRFGDQKYLDEWPERYNEFVASTNVSAGLKPSSLGNFQLSARAGRLMANGGPVIFFHFIRLRVIRQWLYEPSLWVRRVPQTPTTKQHLCVPYARSLRSAARQARAVSSEVPSFDVQPRRRWQISMRQMLQHRTFLVVTDSLAL